jgi:MFS family permease
MPAADILLASAARQRMTVLALSAACFAVSNSAFDMIAPLWATADLGYSAADWAHLRALRFTGTFAGILVLGIVAERVGSRRMAALSLALGGCAMSSMALGKAWLITFCMPLFGALVSTTFVNFNALTQQVTARRQGLANGIYRGIGAGMAIIAPVLATALAQHWGAWSPVLQCAALLTALGGLAILFYPEPGGGDRRSLRLVVQGFLATARKRALWHLTLVDQAMAFTQGAMAAFASLRLTRELGVSETHFGLVCAAGAGLGLVAILAAGVLFQRLPLRWGMFVSWLGSAIGSLVLGVSDSVPLGIAAVLLVATCWPITTVPGSMWIGLCGGASATAFTLHKIIQSGVAVVSMLLLGWLQPRFGMQPLLLAGGILGLPLAAYMLWGMRDPREEAERC